MDYVGITERGDAALDLRWLPWVKENKPAILITKNPEKLYNELIRIPGHKDFNIIIHTTITGFGGTIIEPNVPHYAESLKWYKKLVELYTAERIVLRVDPIIPIKKGIDLAKKIISENVGTRVRISFMDLYNHVKIRFKLSGLQVPYTTIHAPLKLRKKLWKELGYPEVCGEPGLQCCGCVSEVDCKILNVTHFNKKCEQRQYCACLVNKKELLTSKNPCPHKCLYCYWMDK